MSDLMTEQDHRHFALWAAVLGQGLMDAAQDFVTAKACNRPLEAYESLHWLYSNEMSVGSFCWLCDLFELSPAYARSCWRMQVRDLRNKAKKEAKS